MFTGIPTEEMLDLLKTIGRDDFHKKLKGQGIPLDRIDIFYEIISRKQHIGYPHSWDIQRFHSHKFERAIRDKFKLNRPDVGWYQIRKSLEESSDVVVIDFEPFKESYLRLSNKLAPKISEFGFLN